MLKTLKPAKKIPICPLTQFRFFTDKTDKNLPEAPKSKEITQKPYDPKDVKPSDLEWRTPWHHDHGHYYNMLRTFYSEESKRSTLQKLQTEIDLSPTAIKKWWAKQVELRNKELQQYIPERNRILGNELAAAHFVVFRGGAVKFHNENVWYKANNHNEYELPNNYDSTKKLQAIDCSDMLLYYEGFVNLAKLENVEWLSLNGCEEIDDWCLDKVSNIFSHSLLYLDLRNCDKITERGIGALYKMRKLKMLYLDDFLKSTKYEMTCLLLQEVNPDLDIMSDKITF